MKRWLLLICLLFVGTCAFAAEATDFYKLFQPAEQDLSVWYLGNIFGAELVPGDKISGVRLLSVLFGIFNQIALTVGIIIIVYTALAGTLNTAHEGKPLGEKWNSVWMPVRISVGIALLVPKGGTGYCLAQSLVMWLTLQGVGAADTVWNAMVDYFAQGGAIYSNQAAQVQSYMTENNAQYTYALQGSSEPVEGNNPPAPKAKVLNNMVCIALFNNNKDAVELNKGRKYEAYTLAGVHDTVFFGDRTAGIGGTGGSECGAVTALVDETGCTSQECVDNRKTIYTNANWNLAKGLSSLANAIVNDPTDANDVWKQYDSTVKTNTEMYINYLVGYENVLYDKKAAGEALREASAFTVLKKYGWILAGNYYSVLSAFKEKVDYVQRTFRPAKAVNDQVPVPIPTDPTDPAYPTYQAVKQYFDLFHAFADPYSIVAKENAGPTTSKSNRKIGPVNMDEIYKALGSDWKIKTATYDKNAGRRDVNQVAQGASSKATRRGVEDFLKYLTGEGTGSGDLRVAKDPIMRAAKYGKSLTEAAVVLVPIMATIMTVLSALAICSSVGPTAELVRAGTNIAMVPLVSLFIFMYTNGAILGVFIPLIPYVTFFIGVVGWLLQVVEAVAAAPLVAIGLVFPETRDDIWGRAAPAYMLILGLFLRPALMLVGFAAAMMVLWVLTELLNIGFLTLTAVTFRIEDMFGFVVILMAYTGIFTVVVTKSYSLINVVPNKVLSWIGDSSMGVGGAEEAISAAKGGVESGAGAVSAGIRNQGDTAGAGRSADKFGEAADKNSANAADASGKAASGLSRIGNTLKTPPSGPSGGAGSPPGGSPPGGGGTDKK